MAAKHVSPLGTFLTTLFTTLLAPVLVNVVSGTIHPADSNTAPTTPAASPPAVVQPAADARDGWNHPWAGPVPVARGG